MSGYSDKWDLRFLRIAREISTWSRDPRKQVGSVIVRPDRTIVSTGCNDFPRGMPNFKEYYDNREEKLSRIIHAEMNAVLFSRENLNGCTLYTYPIASCDRCVVHMIQAGIDNFVFPALHDPTQERWMKIIETTKKYLNECHKSWTEVEFFD